MNERYLYRAKRIDNGEWVEGDLSYFVHDKESMYVFPPDGLDSPDHYEVDQSTICQCTGLRDRNGELIWENDIVGIPQENGNFVIEWSETEAKWQMNNNYEDHTVDFDNYWSYQVEVIGNIFDNKDLLESEENYGSK